MKTSAYQKRQAAASKRAEKSWRRRIKNVAAVNAERLRQIKLRNKHQCEDHDQPMLSAAGIRYEFATRNMATCYGGIGLAHAMARRSGLADAIDRNVELLQSHFPYHESDHVLNIAFNAMTDGTCLEDLKGKRADAAYLNALGAKRIPDASTAGDFCRRFKSKDDIDCLHTAIDEARQNVWAQQPDEFFDCATVDMDGSIVETTGECKFGMDMSYKGIWGYRRQSSRSVIPKFAAIPRASATCCPASLLPATAAVRQSPRCWVCWRGHVIQTVRIGRPAESCAAVSLRSFYQPLLQKAEHGVPSRCSLPAGSQLSGSPSSQYAAGVRCGSGFL